HYQDRAVERRRACRARDRISIRCAPPFRPLTSEMAMNVKLAAAALVATATLAGGAVAAERTITLKVENMTCDLCAPTVRKSLSPVQGVIRVEVSAEKETATVTFDDAKTSADALTAATKDAGYPSRLAP